MRLSHVPYSPLFATTRRTVRCLEVARTRVWPSATGYCALLCRFAYAEELGALKKSGQTVFRSRPGSQTETAQTLLVPPTAIVHPSAAVATSHSAQSETDKNTSLLVAHCPSLRIPLLTLFKNRRSSGTHIPPDQPPCCLHSLDPPSGLPAPWPRR